MPLPEGELEMLAATVLYTPISFSSVSVVIELLFQLSLSSNVWFFADGLQGLKGLVKQKNRLY